MSVSVIVLAAGYGTRLERDLSENADHSQLRGIPKALLPINGKPLLSHWVEILQQVAKIDHVFIVTNAVYYPQFLKWADQFQGYISILNDLTKCNEERMGAVASIRFAFNSHHLEDKDILVIETEKYGILEIEKDSGKVVRFLEKPKPNDTTYRLACPCFYLLSKCYNLIDNFLIMKKNAPLRERDATGHFIKHLVEESSVYGYQISGRFDVGGLKSYIDCNNYFTEKQNDAKVHSSS